eukprot:4426485-Amphidinium_carterae.1
MADRLDWVPTATGWRHGEKRFTWLMPTTKSNGILRCISVKGVADARPDFQGPRFGNRPCHASFETAQAGWAKSKRREITFGGVWHDARVHA